MTLAEATIALGFASDSYTRRLVKAGTLRAELVGGRYEVEAASVEEYRRRTTLKRSARSFKAPSPASLPAWLEAAP